MTIFLNVYFSNSNESFEFLLENETFINYKNSPYSEKSRTSKPDYKWNYTILPPVKISITSHLLTGLSGLNVE